METKEHLREQEHVMTERAIKLRDDYHETVITYKKDLFAQEFKEVIHELNRVRRKLKTLG